MLFALLLFGMLATEQVDPGGQIHLLLVLPLVGHQTLLVIVLVFLPIPQAAEQLPKLLHLPHTQGLQTLHVKLQYSLTLRSRGHGFSLAILVLQVPVKT